MKKLLVRTEVWGRVLYDPQADEFSAEIDSGEPILSAPLGVGWIIIGACNKFCVQCYGNAEELPRHYLKTADCLKVADRLVEAGVMRVTIAGGEPLLRSDVGVIIERLTSQGVTTILGTNGTFLNSENIDKLKPCNAVEISIDSHIQEVNNRIRPSRGGQGDSLKEATRAIALCVNSGVKVRVLTTLNRLNQDSLLPLAEFLYRLGVREWAISATIAAGRARERMNQLSHDRTVIGAQISRIRNSYPQMKLRMSDRTSLNRFYCLIWPNGHMGTEDSLLGMKHFYGSLLMEKISDSWNMDNYDLQQHFKKWVGDRFLYRQELIGNGVA